MFILLDIVVLISSYGLFRKKKGQAGRLHLMHLKQNLKLLKATAYVQKLK